LNRIAELYDLSGPPTLKELKPMAERWRPFRTWSTVLIRLGADRASRAGDRGA
jgi:3-methyladenine DNA glycosylase/8-oxoguanine DNA glycosylase